MSGQIGLREPVVYLTVIDDAEPPHSLVLTENPTRIGREPTNHVVLRNKFISSHHAEIRRAGGRAAVHDLRTTNGSRIRRNRWLIEIDHRCNHQAWLEDGDELLLGHPEQAVRLRVALVVPEAVSCPDVGGATAIIERVESTSLPELPGRLTRDALAALQDLGARLRPSQTPEALAQSLTGWLLEHFKKATHASVHLANPETGMFMPATTLGRSSAHPDSPVSHGLLGKMLESRNAVAFVGDLSQSLGDSSIREGLCAPMTRGEKILGFVQVDRRGGGIEPGFVKRDLELLATIAAQASLALEASLMRAGMRDVLERAIAGIVAVMETRDSYMAGHSRAVRDLSYRVASRLGLPEEDAQRIARAGALHDIGRFSVPAAILNQHQGLSLEQLREVQRQPRVGAELLQRFGFLDDIVPMVLHVHERWDGTGYPDGLAGQAIPLGARIVAAADAFHTLVSHRAHRAALGETEARTRLAQGAGKHFDPRVIGALEEVLASGDEAWEVDTPTGVGWKIDIDLLLAETT